MVVVKRMSVSFSSCMKKFTNSKTKEKDFNDGTKLESEKPDSDSTPDRSHSVRSLPPDIEQNLRLACTSVLQTRKSYPRHSQHGPASFNRNSYAQPTTGQLHMRDGSQSGTVMDRPAATKTRSPEDRAQRSRAQSRVDALMGRPIYTEQEQEPHGGSHSPA